MTSARLRTVLATLAALVLALDLVVVVQRSGANGASPTVARPPAGSATASPSTSSAAEESVAPSTPPVETGLARLYAEVPWPRIPDTLARTGPIDLDQAAEIDGDGAESKKFLRELGFRRAHIRSWGRVSRNTYLTTLLYEFAAASGARDFADGVFLARSEDGKPAETLGPAGVRTLRDAPDSDGDVLRYAIYARGTRVALVTLLTSNPAPTEAIDVWRAVMAAQAAKL